MPRAPGARLSFSPKPGKRFLGKNSLVFSQRLAGQTEKQGLPQTLGGKNPTFFSTADLFSLTSRAHSFHLARRVTLPIKTKQPSGAEKLLKFFPTPDVRQRKEFLLPRQATRLSKIDATLCSFNYRNPYPESEHFYWPVASHSLGAKTGGDVRENSVRCVE